MDCYQPLSLPEGSDRLLVEELEAPGFDQSRHAELLNIVANKE